MKKDNAIVLLQDMLNSFQIDPESIFIQDLINMLEHYEKCVKSLSVTLNVIRDNTDEEFMLNLQPEIDIYNESFNFFTETI